MPPDFKVIGINDYLFIDGYERVLDAKLKGGCKTSIFILPVVELRLDKFGGTDSHLSRANYHVIFSDDLSPDDIRSQFLNQLVADYTLRDKSFKKAINKTTLAELGQELIDTAPESKRKANQDALTVGFNNITFPLTQIRDLLQNTTFTNKVLTAVGKAEMGRHQVAAERRRQANDRRQRRFRVHRCNRPCPLHQERRRLARRGSQ